MAATSLLHFTCNTVHVQSVHNNNNYWCHYSSHNTAYTHLTICRDWDKLFLHRWQAKLDQFTIISVKWILVEIKVTNDILHQEIFASNISWQGKQLWNWNKIPKCSYRGDKNSCYNFEATKLSQKSNYDRHCHYLMHQVLPRQRLLAHCLLLSYWVLNLWYSNAEIGSLVHTEPSLQKKSYTKEGHLPCVGELHVSSITLNYFLSQARPHVIQVHLASSSGYPIFYTLCMNGRRGRSIMYYFRRVQFLRIDYVYICTDVVCAHTFSASDMAQTGEGVYFEYVQCASNISPPSSR